MMSKMTSRVLVDSAVWVANLNANDVWHKESGIILTALSERRAILVITEFILSEVVGKIRLRVGQNAASRFYRNILEMEEARILQFERVGRGVEEKAMRVLEKYPDLKKLSFVDACSAVLVKDKRVDAIATFDRDFKEIRVKTFVVD